MAIHNPAVVTLGVKFKTPPTTWAVTPSRPEVLNAVTGHTETVFRFKFFKL